MKKDVEAHINGKVLKWAREQINVSISDVVSKLKSKRITDDLLISWEEGKSFPSVSILKKLAELYKFKFTIFYLPEVPKKIKPIRNFRRLSFSNPGNLVFLIRDLQSKQGWLSEYFIKKSLPINRFVGINHIDSSIDSVIKSLNNIGLKPSNYWAKKPDYMLKDFINIIEKNNIFISMTSGINNVNTIDVCDARGFAISDKYTPFIFINSKDDIKARIFTLVHELLHVIFNKQDILDIPNDREEIICNRITAEFLLPKQIFEDTWKLYKQTDDINEVLNKLSKFFNSSLIFTLIRARELDLLSNNDFKRIRSDLERSKKITKTKETSFGNYFSSQAKRNSKQFSRYVLKAFEDKDIRFTDVYNLIHVKYDKLDKYIEQGKIYQE